VGHTAAVEREISTAGATGHCSFFRLTQAPEGDGIAQRVNGHDAVLPIPAGRYEHARDLGSSESGYPGLAVLTQPRSAGQKHVGRQIFTRFRLNRSAGRAFATPMRKALTTELGGHVESLCCRGCCFRSFCRVLQPTR
jgi:hypothetical protein